MYLLCSLVFEATFPVTPLECGGDDGARTRDLCRDSEKEGRNLQKTSVRDGLFWRCKERAPGLS